MAKRRWTILIVPQSAGATREVQLSLRALKVWTGLATLFVVASVALFFTAVSKAVDLSRLERLERRNEVLAKELGSMGGMVSFLSDTLAAITERDRTVRLLAGLEPISADVLQAGVGGPAGPTSLVERLLEETPLGRQTLDTRDLLETLNRRALMLASSFQQAVDTLDNHIDRLGRTPSIRPTMGFVSSGYSRSRMHPLFKENRPHEGTDFVAPAGATIVATASGRVVDVGTKIGYGLVVTINHGDGLQTRYAHCSKILVRAGQQVARGDKIAEVGRTGWATNHHVHYEVLLNGVAVDPSRYLFNGRIVD